MKGKFEKLRDLASDVSDTTIEDVNTYTVLSFLRSLASDVSDTTVEDANTYTSTS